MALRYATMLLAAGTLAAILGVSAAEPEEAAAASAAGVRSCAGRTVDLSPDEARMLDLHNEARTDRGLPRMCVHPALQRAARAHSQEMLDRDYFSHDSANGDRFWVRLERFGYNWRTAGENILYDPGSPDSTQSVFRVWMQSPDHKSNIINGRFREVGVGARSGNYKGSKATMWTVDFGTR